MKKEHIKRPWAFGLAVLFTFVAMQIIHSGATEKGMSGLVLLLSCFLLPSIFYVLAFTDTKKKKH